jgi:hypothetical protein
MKRALFAMATIVFMSFMVSQAMAWNSCGMNGGYVGDQYGGGYTNTDPNVNTNTNTNTNSNTGTNVNSNTTWDANYQNFLTDTASLREQLAAKQSAYTASISKQNPNQKYTGQLCRQMARLNNQIWDKAVYYGCTGWGYSNGNSNTTLDPNYQKFLTDTASLREQLAAKQGEYVALISQPNPDPKLASQLCLQIAKLNSQIRDMALSYGLTAAGYQGYCGGWGW